MNDSNTPWLQRHINLRYAFWILLMVVSLGVLVYGGYRLVMFDSVKNAQQSIMPVNNLMLEIKSNPTIVNSFVSDTSEVAEEVLSQVNKIGSDWEAIKAKYQFLPEAVLQTDLNMQLFLDEARKRIENEGSFLMIGLHVDSLLDSLEGHRVEVLILTGAPLHEAELIAILAAIVLLILSFVVLGLLFNQDVKSRIDLTEKDNGLNQAAILRLLDELADLADGDLTVTTTVSEDFTGAIADSVNFTIDQLRQLVSRINQTASQVSTAAQDSQQTAFQLAEASTHQAQEIAGASAAINEMAVTIDQVSANAAESALVASKSVSIANNGSKLVQNTIHGMDTIREQIQDTSKRIKRLGESSQEIGDIVSLINDIADQTNILALNAAIQASMAGDAGRGFAVVADEVQRLAERSTSATKQIESLVRTIQSDTNEAVTSMEQTTSEVVSGARLAQDAGVALEEIEGVSVNIAELIQNISNAARQQASSAGHISNTMNVIQEITSQTSAGTGATAQAIGDLAGMALELRESVAGFTLPDDMAIDMDMDALTAAADTWSFDDGESLPEPQSYAPSAGSVAKSQNDPFELSDNLLSETEEEFDHLFEEESDVADQVVEQDVIADDFSMDAASEESEFDFSEDMIDLANSEDSSDEEFDFSDFEFTEEKETNSV